MSKSLIRLMMAVSLCLGLGLTACGPDENNGNNDGGCTEDADCSGEQVCDTDTNMCVDDTGCESDDDCTGDQTCDTDTNMCVDPGCESDDDCTGDQVCDTTTGMCQDPEADCTDDSQCDAGEFCSDAGTCDSGQCANVPAGSECDANLDPAGNGFVCVGVGEGSSVCAATETCPTEAGADDPCTAGSECLTVGDGSTGACVVTQCQIGAGECDTGAACQPISRDTNLCLPTGSGAEGDNCAQNFTDFSSTRCGDGLFCDLFYSGVCRTGCSADGDCSGLNSCVGADDGDIYGNSEGFCAEGCEPFGDRATCGDGFGCNPITADQGLCEAAGDVEMYGACQATACESDDDCPTDITCVIPSGSSSGQCDFGAQCAGDSRCITLQAASGPGQDAVARCLPACDPTAENPDNTCPTANPKSFVRFQNLSAALAGGGTLDIDIYVDGSEVTSGNTFPSAPITQLDFLEVDPGQHEVEVYVDGADTTTEDPLASISIDLEVNAQMTYVFTDALDPADGTTIIQTILPYSTPRGVAPVAGAAKVRLHHGVFGLPTNIDVYLDTATGDESTFPDFSSATPIIADLGYGEVSNFPDPNNAGETVPFTELAEGAYDAVIVPTGADPTDSNNYLAAFHSLAAPAGAIVTLNAIGAAGQVPPNVVGVPYGAAAETRILGGYCLDLSGQDQDASPRTGVCLEKCRGAADYGEGICSADVDGDHCTPFRDRSVCWPSARLEVDANCDPTSINPCVPGAYCRGDGAGNGVCKMHCSLDENVTNATLGCTETGESCAPIEYGPWDVGECRQECDLANNPDTNCPANLQQCLPIITDDTFTPATNYCRQSGDVALGETCSGATQNDCVPTALCAQGPADSEAVCKQACDMLASDSGCGDSEVCYPSFAGGSSSVGFCVDEDPDLTGTASLGQCPLDKAGNPCGNGSICIGVGQGQAACLQFCDIGSNTGCTGDEVCNPAGPLFGIASYEGDPDLPYTLGVCLPPG